MEFENALPRLQILDSVRIQKSPRNLLSKANLERPWYNMEKFHGQRHICFCVIFHF